MKNMKRIVSTALVALMCIAGGAQALASETEMTYTHKNDPTYTITIPAQITLEKDGTDVEIVASEIADLGDQRISVTVAGTNYYRNQFVLDGDTRPATSIRYSLTLEDGTVLETTGGKDEHVGKELASFTADGASNYRVTPIITATTVVGGTYTGTLTYGIKLV